MRGDRDACWSSHSGSRFRWRLPGGSLLTSRTGLDLRPFYLRVLLRVGRSRSRFSTGCDRSPRRNASSRSTLGNRLPIEWRLAKCVYWRSWRWHWLDRFRPGWSRVCSGGLGWSTSDGRRGRHDVGSDGREFRLGSRESVFQLLQVGGH